MNAGLWMWAQNVCHISSQTGESIKHICFRNVIILQLLAPVQVLHFFHSQIPNQCWITVVWELFLFIYFWIYIVTLARRGCWINSVAHSLYCKSWQSNPEQSSLVNLSVIFTSLLKKTSNNSSNFKCYIFCLFHMENQWCWLSASWLEQLSLLPLPKKMFLRCVTCYSERLQRRIWIMYFEVFEGI